MTLLAAARNLSAPRRAEARLVSYERERLGLKWNGATVAGITVWMLARASGWLYVNGANGRLSACARHAARATALFVVFGRPPRPNGILA